MRLNNTAGKWVLNIAVCGKQNKENGLHLIDKVSKYLYPLALILLIVAKFEL